MNKKNRLRRGGGWEIARARGAKKKDIEGAHKKRETRKSSNLILIQFDWTQEDAKLSMEITRKFPFQTHAEIEFFSGTFCDQNT